MAEPAEPGRVEEDDTASELPTAVISPALVAKQDPVLAEVAQNAEKFLDAVVKVCCCFLLEALLEFPLILSYSLHMVASACSRNTSPSALLDILLCVQRRYSPHPSMIVEAL